MSLRSLFCLFLSCRFTPVTLYFVFIDNSDDFYEDLDKESKEENKQTVKDKESTSDKDKNKAKKKIAQQALSREYVEYDEEDSSGHFMAFFLTATVLCVAGYVIFHNKQKVMMADSSLYLRHLCRCNSLSCPPGQLAPQDWDTGRYIVFVFPFVCSSLCSFVLPLRQSFG